MAIEVLQNEEISGGEKEWREKRTVLPSVREERMRGAYTLRYDSEKELLFREMLAPS